MTDHYRSLTVVIDDMRDDDAEPLIKAIERMRGVRSVTGNVADLRDHTAYEHARWDLQKKLWSVLKPSYLKDDEEDTS